MAQKRKSRRRDVAAAENADSKPVAEQTCMKGTGIRTPTLKHTKLKY